MRKFSMIDFGFCWEYVVGVNDKSYFGLTKKILIKKIIPHKIWITEKSVEWRDNSGIRVSSYIISFIVFLLSMSRLNYSFLGQKIQLLNNCKIELEYCSTFEAAKKPVYYTKFSYTLYILQTNHR